MKRKLLILFCFLAWNSGFAQNLSKIDSLKQELLKARQDTNKVKIYWSLSEIFSDTDSSLFYAREGLELSRAINYARGEARSLYKMAAIYRKTGDPISQSEYLQKALEIFKKTGNKRGIMSSLELYSEQFYWQNNFRNELDVCHLPALKIARELRDTSWVAGILGNIGKTYVILGHLDSAEIALTEGYRLMRHRLASLDKNDPVYHFAKSDAAYIFAQLGSLKRHKAENDEALVYLRQALALCIESNDKQQTAYVYKHFSETYLETNQIDSALYYANQSLNTVVGVALDSLELRAESEELLSRIYERMGDYKEALRFKKMALSAREKLYNDDKMKKLSNLTFREKQRALELATAKTAYQNKLRQYALIIGLGILLLVAFFLYRNNRQKQRANALLQEQKDKVEGANATLQIAHREVRIEAALERVRSQIMSMQRSDELAETVSVLFRQILGMGIQPAQMESCIVVTFNTVEPVGEVWLTMPDGELIPHSFKVPYNEDPLFIRIYTAWKAGEKFLVEHLAGKELLRHFSYLVKHTPLPFLEMRRKDYAGLPNEGYTHALFFSQGYLAIITREPVPEFHDIFKRFGNVFQQAYTRFLDLQKAEARAIEAARTASLDRVRAEIASMRTAADLQRITPLVWRELTTLGVPFFRCGVFIMDAEKELVHTYLSTPDGKSLSVLQLPFDGAETTRNTVKHWRKQEVYLDNWDKQQFTEWVQSLTEQGYIKEGKAYQGAEQPPENLALHFVPFKQGMLYVGNSETLSEEQIDLVQRLADTFAVAYSRYEDFTKLEEAKKQVESAFTELKATQTQLIQSEKLASLGEMTAGIAHEIQNPLNFVNNFSELSVDLATELKEEMDKVEIPEKDKAYIGELLTDLGQNQQKINHHGKRAAAIVSGMLYHARASTGKKEPTDLNALADEYLRLAYHGLRAKDPNFNAAMVTDFDPAVGTVDVIPQDIGRVLLNLINNAFYAVQQRALEDDAARGLNLPGFKNLESLYTPTVTVSTQKTDNQIIIKVKDNGTGIPEDVKAKIFQPFFTTKPTGQGMGLGLSLAYDIVVKGHGGTLEVETKEGEGTEFIIRI